MNNLWYSMRFTGRRGLKALALPALGAVLALGVSTAGAVTVTTLTLSDVSDPTTNNPTDVQCIMYGNSCPKGQQAMSSLNYDQTGNETSWNLYSTPDTAGTSDGGVVRDPYTVAYLAGFVGRVFGIGIDVNTAGGHDPEQLQLFEVDVDTGSGWDTYFRYTGPGNLDPANNGNGFFDFALTTVDLSSFAGTDKVRFHAVWDQASDGAENFFVYRVAAPIPEPSTYALMFAGLAAVGFMARRRRQS